LYSLQILQTESHPHSHNQGPTTATPGSKEGFSIYGLFHYLAHTPQGKSLLRRFFLRPSVNLDVINERLDTISVFLRPENSVQLDELVKNLKKVKNMRTVMINLRKGVGSNSPKGGISGSIWSTIRNFVFHALKIRDFVPELNGHERLHICAKVLDRFESFHLAQVGRKITEVVDFDESRLQHRTVVCPHIDIELDQLKCDYNGLESMLSAIGREIAKTVPASFQPTLNVIYFPQIGFLISVQREPDVNGISLLDSNDEPWERIFTTNQIEYYKNSEMREMDERFGDLWTAICDKEIDIIHELAQGVLEHEELLTKVSDICGELDCLLALAQGARQYKLCRPRMTTDNIIQIKGGRHILQELIAPSYVANDTNIAGGRGSCEDEVLPSAHSSDRSQRVGNAQRSESDFGSSSAPSMFILTGPNYSGKSVYLKQVALIVYMAHLGSFVPAESASIGITDKILTRISTRESVSREQSAFMIDLQQISLALSSATRRSLLVIDEFGKGTESVDGAGLMSGVLEYLNHLGDQRPKVLAATHFHGKIPSLEGSSASDACRNHRKWLLGAWSVSWSWTYGSYNRLSSLKSNGAAYVSI